MGQQAVEAQVSKVRRHSCALVVTLSCIKIIKRNKMSNKYCSGGLFIDLVSQILDQYLSAYFSTRCRVGIVQRWVCFSVGLGLS